MRTQSLLKSGLAIALFFMLAGCGLKTGYAPTELTLHQGKGAAVAAADPESLLVVSWNIQYGINVDQALLELRTSDQLKNADIILLQEMDTAGTEMMADELDYHFVYSPASVNPAHSRLFGNAVLSRWPLADVRAVILPHETLLTGHRRIAVAADVALGSTTLRVVSVHTATMVMDLDKRQEQAQAVLDSLGGSEYPMIIGGDFNSVSDFEVTELRQIMRRLRFDTVRLPEGPTIRNKIKKLPGTVPVLDHFFIRGLEAGSRGVDRATEASDHYPIWTVVRIADHQPGAHVKP